MSDTLNQILTKLGGLFSLSALSVALIFIVVLSVIVFVHEFGHYIVGRWCGVGADEFSIGFGREIFGWTDRRNTRWKVCWLPLGGYVRFVGDANAASQPDGEALVEMTPEQRAVSLFAQPVWKRALVIAAGPMANFLFAIVIFSAFLAVNGKTNLEPRIDQVVPGSRAEAAGLKAGDLILAVNGRPVEDFSEVTQRVVVSAGEPMQFRVQRNSETLEIVATPELKKIKSAIGYVDGGQLGFLVDPSIPGRLKNSPLSLPGAVAEGGSMTWAIIDMQLSTIGKLITGKISFNQLSGPLGIAQMTGKVAERGVLDLVWFAAFLSVSIGMVNLLPIPVLDGGHLLFCLVEVIARRPLNERIQELAFRIGLALILVVFVLVSLSDIARNFAQ